MTTEVKGMKNTLDELLAAMERILQSHLSFLQPLTQNNSVDLLGYQTVVVLALVATKPHHPFRCHTTNPHRHLSYLPLIPFPIH